MPRTSVSRGARVNPALHLTPLLPQRQEKIAEMLGLLARRASTWGWRGVFEKIRRGEDVPKWHRRMVELTAARLAHEMPAHNGGDDE